MKDTRFENWENRLRSVAADLTFPPTPDIAGQVMRRLEKPAGLRTTYIHRVVWTIAVIVILVLATILLVPPVRAAVLDFLQIGAVRIFLIEPTPTGTSTPAPATPTPAQAKNTPLPTATTRPTSIYLASLLDLQGETTLDQAIDRLSFTPSLPTYPTDMGDPDHVFLQDQGGQMLFLVWTDPQHPDTVRLSLHEISPGSWAVTKFQPIVVDQTKVNGQNAYWTEGPYLLTLTNGDVDLRRLVDGHVLIWEQDGITYRLESDVSMQEAVKIAESLTPIAR